MRIIITSLIIYINFILQSTLFEYIELFGVRPNTAIVVIVSIAMLRFDAEGAVTGFFAGLLQDIVFGRVIGFYALLYMVIGYFCGKPFKDFYSENYIPPLFLVVISTFFLEFSTYAANFLFRGRLDLLYYTGRIVLPAICYNALLTIPVYRFIYGINNMLEERGKSNRRLF